MGKVNYSELDWREAMVLGTALQEGLLDAIATERKTSSDVARELGLDERAVHALLAALVELDILDEDDSGFVLREKHREPLVEREARGYLAGRVVHRFGMMQKWARLPEILKTGESMEDRTRANFGGTATFIQAMRHGAREGVDEVTEAVLSLLPKGAHILDVGGGPGTNAESFAASGARVTVFDRPEVMDLMRETLSEAGIETESGDMNEELPSGPFDAIYFGNTSHMYGPEENRMLFGRMRAILRPGGFLILREFVRGMSEEAALFAVNMLVLTPGGGTYTQNEYERWLEGSGFENVEVHSIPGRTTFLIVARNPG